LSFHFRVFSLTQSVIDVDSLHPWAHPNLPTVELHGYLRSAVCLSCSSEYSRELFQDDSARLNPSWAKLLSQLLDSGALTTDDPRVQATRGLRTNPDGDVDLPGLSYSSFRYPPCPTCLALPPKNTRVTVDGDGAWLPESTAGILKPAVVMFGEAVSTKARDDANHAVNRASRLLVVGTSLATYSAWRLVKQASEAGMRIAILNLGGVRGEEVLVGEQGDDNGLVEVRINLDAQEVLPALVKELER
jgi:NAD+-dependent protein deacetylase sirtuin 4